MSLNTVHELDHQPMMSNPQNMSEEERQAKVRATLKLKKDVSALLTSVRAQAAIAERYANENQYLKEYIGSSMKSGDLK